MALDLNFGLEIVVCPIVREPDGLAMSSRNAYLSDEERKQATVLSQALTEANRSYTEGERDCSKLKDLMESILKSAPKAGIDYCEVVDAETVQPIDRIEGKAVAALAVLFGKTRLIDNHIFGEKNLM